MLKFMGRRPKRKETKRGDNGVSSGGCRDAVSGAVREEMCACLCGTFLPVYTVVPVRLEALPDTLLSSVHV